MKKIIKIIIPQILIVITFYIIIPSVFIRRNNGQVIEGGQAIFPLQNNKYYTQKINNPTHNLDSLSLHLKNPMNQDNSLINIQILEDDKILRKFIIYGSNVGDPSWIKLDFSPIYESNLIIKISSDSPRDNSLYLYADNNLNFDLKTSYRLPSLFKRIGQNIKYQIYRFQQRSQIHNVFYLILIISLNIIYIRYQNEGNRKK